MASIAPHRAIRPAGYPSRLVLDPVWAGYMGVIVPEKDQREWPDEPPFCVECGQEMLTIGDLMQEGRPEWHAEEDLNP
jgi:hypothetical protein